jgi:ddrB-like ParB superfamily domain
LPDVVDQIAAEDTQRAAPQPAPGRGGARAPDVVDQVHADKLASQSNIQRFAQSWWDNSVLEHPIDSAVSLVKSLVTMPDYHQLSDAEKAQVDAQMEKAWNDAAANIKHPTPEYTGMLASKATNAAIVAGATYGVGKGLGAAVDVAPHAWEAVKAGVSTAAPDVAKGAALTGGALAAADVMPGPAWVKTAVGIPGTAPGVLQIRKGLVQGFAAAKNAWADSVAARIVAKDAAAPPVQPRALLPAGPIITPPPADVSGPIEPILPENYNRAPASPGGKSWEPGTPGTPAPPERWEPLKAEHIDQYDAAAATKPEAQPAGDIVDQIHAEATGQPGARETLSPELAARVEQLRAETHSPEELERARLADWVMQRQAHGEMNALDREWQGRAAKADHIAEFVLRHNLEQTPAMYAKVADELGYDKPPSEDAQQMIDDRVDWFRARHPALAPAPVEVMPAQAQLAAPAVSIGQMAPRAAAALTPAAATTLEQQLRDSLAARGVPVDLERGRPAETAAETVRGTGAGAPGSSGGLDERGTGDGAPLPAASSGGESGQRRAAGDRTTVRVPGEAKQYAGRYEVKELADLQPSHNGQTFQKNPRYEHSNDRDYNNPDNQRKIVDASVGGDTGFDPRYVINTAPDASLGPPVIDSRNNVLGGNGRTMTIQRVFDGNADGVANYRRLLDKTAHHFGIDPESYAHMKEPVLVRTLDPAETGDAAAAQRAVTDFNKVGTAALTPAERAIADAHGVSQKTLDDVGQRIEHAGEDATFNSMLDEGRNGVEILKNLINDGVISPQERAQLASTNELKPMGRARISNLMLGRFFTNAQQLDNLPLALRAKMERIAAPLARAEGSAEYSLSPTVREALDLIDAADMHGVPNLRDFVNQRGLYADRQFSPASLRIAEQLRTRDPVALTNAMRQYATRAKEAADYQGPGVFGDIPAPLTRGEAFNESFGPEALERDRIAKEADKARKAAAKAAKKAAEVPAE